MGGVSNGRGQQLEGSSVGGVSNGRGQQLEGLAVGGVSNGRGRSWRGQQWEGSEDKEAQVVISTQWINCLVYRKE